MNANIAHSSLRIAAAAGFCLFAGAALFAGPAMSADEDLVVFDWAGYDDPNFFANYIDQHGDAPTFSFFGDEEEAFQKLRAGFKADVAHPCSQSIVKWRDADLIEPWDTSRIPAFGNLVAGMADQPGFSDAGGQYMIPLDWGNTALTYRTDTVDVADIGSLQAFVDPKFQGQTSIGDNVDDAYALAFLATGVYDWTTASDAQFEAASDWLRQAHENVRTYWSDPADLAQQMAGGEVNVAWAWNETATRLAGEGHPVAMKRDTDEGITTWVCGYVRLKGGEGDEAKAYDFINAFLADNAAEYLVYEWGYGHSNQAALDRLDQGLLADMGYTDLAGFKDKTLWQSPVPSGLRERMIAEFEKIKAGF